MLLVQGPHFGVTALENATEICLLGLSLPFDEIHFNGPLEGMNAIDTALSSGQRGYEQKQCLDRLFGK